MIERSTGEFMGWAGLKLITTEINGHINFHDVGYRLIKRFWGKGYASEASVASAKYAFEQLHLTDLYGLADINNLASRRVLQKTGLKEINTFDLDGMDIVWLHAKRPD
jgi:[ribosomal protein S5]-alanine N-acetyltransferase